MRLGPMAAPWLTLFEQNDEWPLQHRYLQIEGMAELETPAEAHPSLIAETDAAA